MKINREQVYKEYMEWVNKVSDDLDDKTYFSPKEIVEKICEIIENIKEWQQKNGLTFTQKKTVGAFV